MSISSSGTRKSGPYTGNGATSAFPFTFKVFQASDVLVVQTDTTPADHALALNTDYTVVLNANQDANPGGTVNMVAPPPSGYLLTIGSNVPELQSVTLTNNGGFYPSVINSALDYLTILVQQISEKMGRALVMPFSTNASGQLPPVAPGQLLGWKADGTGIDNIGATGVGAGGIVAANLAAGAAGTALSTDTQAASAKAIPVDADEIPLFDSASFWYLKKFTWSNLKSAIGTLLNMTGAINYARTTVASAAIPDIWTGTGNNINYTGTVTATGFAAAPQAGASRILDCAAACSFDAGANMLIDGMQSGQTLTVAAGDRVEVFARATTQFVLNHLRRDGTLDTTVTVTGDPGYVDNSANAASTGWIRGAMSAIAIAGGFASSLGTNGYVRLPSWLGAGVFQWGYVASQATGAFTITFPLAFPNAAGYANYVLSTNNAAGNANNPVSALAATSFSGANWNGAAGKLYWFAIGY